MLIWNIFKLILENKEFLMNVLDSEMTGNLNNKIPAAG